MRHRATPIIIFIGPAIIGFCLWLSSCSTDDNAGTPGPASDAGTAGDRGIPSSDELLRTLARNSACMQTTKPVGIGMMYAMFDAYQWLAGLSQSTEVTLTATILDCYFRATTCEEVLDCLLASDEEASVCDGTDDSHCYGNVLVECTENSFEQPEAYDCAAAGLVCGEGENYAECGERRCESGDDSSFCEGDVLWECDYSAGVYIARDCRYTVGTHCSSEGEGDWVCRMYAGGTCGEHLYLYGESDCVGTGSECVWSTFENRCEGSTLVSCHEGRESRFDCRNAGSAVTCGEGESGDMACIEAEGACSLSDPESCDQGIITFCAAGQVQQLDCTAYGYSGCATTSGFSGVIGYCTI